MNTPIRHTAVTCGLLLLSATARLRADEPSPHPGAKIFAAKCAECHGTDGQGADAHESPLYGDDTIKELALLIERTMPEGAPEECVGEEAAQVAAYIHSEFYSPAARQAKGLASAPRIEPMRLTVDQHRNAIADIIRHFTPQPESKRSPEPGIQGTYYESEKMTKTKKEKFDRVDSKIQFDFGAGAPKKAGKKIPIDKKQFAVIWDGSIDIRDTGDYEFRIKSPNGIRLYLNLDYQPSRRGLRDDSGDHGQSALIDGWVAPLKTRELTARVFLQGGRRYPIRLEFFKYLEENSSVELTWKPPHGVWDHLDADHLTTAVSTRTFVVDSPFPADDRSHGYERGTSVSKEWHAAANNATIAAANEIVNRLPLLARVDDKSEPAELIKKLTEFTLEFARTAWRRPLTDSEDELFRTAFFTDDMDREVATKRAVIFVLQSPHFLYTDLTPSDQAPNSHTVAARLAFAIWDSIPDEELRKWAEENAKNKNIDSKLVADQARRMLDDSRAKAKLRGFFHHWLEFDERERVKDKSQFPEFDSAVMSDLRRSLELFVDEIVWSETSDYRQLLLADHLVLNDRLAKLYATPPTPAVEGENEDQNTEREAEEEVEENAGQFENVVLTDQNRAGVLTHPYLLSAQAYADKTSPIHRGVFLTRNIVGRGLNAPPEAVAFKDEEFASDLTMREKITQLTSSTTCMSCHSVINPLGFALESYDTIGRWRTTEDEKPIDTVSEYLARDGTKIRVHNARDVAEFAIGNASAQRAFVTQLFHHTVKQDPLAYDRKMLDELRHQFVQDEFNIQSLWIQIATRTALK